MNKAVARAVRILEYAANSERYTTLSNISINLGIPKTSAFDIVHALIDGGYLEIIDEKRMILGLGVKLLELGNLYRVKNPFWSILHREMQKLSDECQRAVFFWVNVSNDMVLFDSIAKMACFYPNYAIGEKIGLCDTSIGQTFLSTMSTSEISQKLAACPESSVVVNNDFLECLNSIRQQRFALDANEATGIFTVSSPIHRIDHACDGILCVYDLVCRISAEERSRLVSQLLLTAKRLSLL